MSSHHHHHSRSHSNSNDDDASGGYYAPLNDSARLPMHAQSNHSHYTDEEAGLLERALASNDSLADQAFQYDDGHHLHDDNDEPNEQQDDNKEASYSASVLLNKISAAMESEEASSPRQSQSAQSAQSSHRHNLQTAVRVGAMTAAVTADDCSEVQSVADVGSIGGIESAVPASASAYASPRNQSSARERAQAIIAQRSQRVSSDQMGSASGLGYTVRRSGNTASVHPSLHGSSLRDSAYIDYDYDFADEFSEDGDGHAGSSPSRVYSIRTASTSNSSGRSLRRDRYGNPTTAAAAHHQHHASYTSLEDASMSESLLDRVAAAERQQHHQASRYSPNRSGNIRRGSYSSHNSNDDDGARPWSRVWAGTGTRPQRQRPWGWPATPSARPGRPSPPPRPPAPTPRRAGACPPEAWRPARRIGAASPSPTFWIGPTCCPDRRAFQVKRPGDGASWSGGCGPDGSFPSSSCC